MYVVLVTTYILMLPEAYALVVRGSKYANTFLNCKCTTLHGSLTTICGHVALHMGPLKSVQFLAFLALYVATEGPTLVD